METEKVVLHETVLANNIAETMVTSNGETPGVLGVENGETIQVEDVQILKELVKRCIRYQKPFECTDWDVLCSSIIEEYEASWGTSLIWVLGSIRYLKKFEKDYGSWNVPLQWVFDCQKEKPAYKVFREHSVNTEHPLKYEFHPASVPINQWINAEVSGSPYLSGIRKKEEGGHGGKFHMLTDIQQATAYLNSRIDTTGWFTRQEAVIKEVKGRNFVTIDLVYSPPKTFVWGIDAEEMYVEHDMQPKTETYGSTQSTN